MPPIRVRGAHLVQVRQPTPHQLSEVEGSQFCTAALTSVVSRPAGLHHGGVLYQQAGWDTFPLSAPSESTTIPVASDPQHIAKSQTCTRLTKCYSWLKISAGPAGEHKVKSTLCSSKLWYLPVGDSHSRDVCHGPKYSASPVHVASPGHRSTWR